VSFEELPAQFADYMTGRVTGRTVVRIAPTATNPE